VKEERGSGKSEERDEESKRGGEEARHYNVGGSARAVWRKGLSRRKGETGKE